MIYLLHVARAFAGALAYRVRGGAWIVFGHTSVARLFWTIIGLSAPYFMLGAVNLYYGLSLVVTGYLSMLVPHAFAQNMGRWPTPQVRWPAFFLPELTQAQWGALPMFWRTAYDFGGMLGVGFFRGAIVFLPFIFTGWDSFEVIRAALLAWGAITIGQPVACLLGRFTPITIGSELQKYTAAWGEFWCGAAWTIAEICLS